MTYIYKLNGLNCVVDENRCLEKMPSISEQSEDLNDFELIYSPVLNFVQSNWQNSISEKEIIEYGVDFFASPKIVEAKADLWSKLEPDEIPPRRSGAKSATSNIKDMLDLLKKCDEASISMPTYVIKLPTEVPVLPAVAYSQLASKVSKVHQLVQIVSAKLDNYSLNYPQLPKPIGSNRQSTTIVVSQVPSHLSDPIKRKDAIDKISGHELVSSIRPVHDKWYVNIDKSAAEDFRASVPVILAGTSTKEISKKYSVIIKGVPEDYAIQSFTNCSGIVAAKRLGSSKTVKLDCVDSFAKAAYFKDGVRIGYEFFRLSEFKEIPKCCFKCRSPHHFQSSCPSPVPKCARCAGPHIISKENPCNASPKCANCNGEHVSFSMSCSVLRGFASQQTSK